MLHLRHVPCSFIFAGHVGATEPVQIDSWAGNFSQYGGTVIRIVLRKTGYLLYVLVSARAGAAGPPSLAATLKLSASDQDWLGTLPEDEPSLSTNGTSKIFLPTSGPREVK